MKKREIILQEFEKILNINFNDKNLLNIALTHSSYANQKKNIQFNERLEFLGDAVLQLCISEYLFKNYKDKSEGDLTKARSLIVCEKSLYNVSKKWQVGNYINMSKGEELTGGKKRVSILADCVEAIIAAVYLDAGLDEAKKFIFINFEGIINKAINNEIVLDYKTKLQELLQQNGEIIIKYELVDYEGPPHNRKFFVNVLVNGKLKGKGEGLSKKEAEQRAAKMAFDSLEVEYE